MELERVTALVGRKRTVERTTALLVMKPGDEGWAGVKNIGREKGLRAMLRRAPTGPDNLRQRVGRRPDLGWRPISAIHG